MKNIVIVGGGSAGWMTAATLIKCFPSKKITLIESPEIPTVGVGESTIAQIREWQSLIDIKDEDFIPYCDASYKLSIKFTDFYKKGESFHYPFGDPFLKGNANQLNDWWFKKFAFPETPYSDYAVCHYPQMALVLENKCFFNEKNIIPFDFKKHSAFHFDATKFALWLRDNYCIPRGVQHIKEEIKTIEQDENGIKSLNNTYKADLFIDCTGFKSLLLGQALKEPFEDFKDLLPNNKAWATHLPYTDKEKQLVCYTNCTAYNNGWIWNIPLWSRIGTGYVYSDKFISDDDALKEFQTYLGTKELNFKKIEMRTGLHRRLWVKNVCAIGLSAGFIEPLESNGLFSVHEFLHKLVRTLQRDKVSQWDRDNFTAVCKTLFNNFKEFVAMHYALSHRDDTPYWKSILKKEWSSNLIDQIPAFGGGFIKMVYDRYHHYRFEPHEGIHCIAAGMHIGPTDIPSLIKHNYEPDLKFWKQQWEVAALILNDRKDKWTKKIKYVKSLPAFLKMNFYERNSS